AAPPHQPSALRRRAAAASRLPGNGPDRHPQRHRPAGRGDGGPRPGRLAGRWGGRGTHSVISSRRDHESWSPSRARFRSRSRVALFGRRRFGNGSGSGSGSGPRITPRKLMKKEMLINVLQPEECRIAILEDGILEGLYVERTSHESYVGNIYKGR